MAICCYFILQILTKLLGVYRMKSLMQRRLENLGYTFLIRDRGFHVELFGVTIAARHDSGEPLPMVIYEEKAISRAIEHAKAWRRVY